MSIAYASEQLERKFPSDGGLVFARQGEALFRENWTDECIKLLMEGTRKHPDYVTGFLVLGRIYKEMGRLVEAQHALQEALRLDACCPSALRLLGEISEGLQAYGESARYLDLLASQEPWDEDFHSAHRRALGLSGVSTPASGPPAEGPATGEFASAVGEFLPKDEASLETVFGAGSTATEDLTVFVPPPAEPKPMDVFRDEPATREMGEALSEASPFSGSDVESRLDTLFGTESSISAATPAAEKAKAAEPTPDSDVIYMPPGEEALGATDTAFVPSANAPVQGADIEKRLDDLFTSEPTDEPLEEERPGTGTATVEAAAVMGGGPTSPDAPITGEDVEKHLDELFFPDAEAPVAKKPSKPPDFAGLDDRTIALPAFRAPKPLPEAEPVAETVIQSEELHAAQETGLVEAAHAPEAVVGDDIGQRLDQLFGAEEAGATAFAEAAADDEPGTSETATFAAGAAATLMVEQDHDDSKVSGDDVEARLSQIFESGEIAPKQPVSLTDDDSMGASQTLGLSRDAIFGQDPEKETPPAPAPLPRMEEEVAEALSDAEETAAAPPNVATVTLAEIYFQQGLKEQALQIYRQLLEREPDNETARKRIQEIETAKPESETGGEDSDRRPPRPGMKVPRRKK